MLFQSFRCERFGTRCSLTYIVMCGSYRIHALCITYTHGMRGKKQTEHNKKKVVVNLIMKYDIDWRICDVELENMRCVNALHTR